MGPIWPNIMMKYGHKQHGTDYIYVYIQSQMYFGTYKHGYIIYYALYLHVHNIYRCKHLLYWNTSYEAVSVCSVKSDTCIRWSFSQLWCEARIQVCRNVSAVMRLLGLMLFLLLLLFYWFVLGPSHLHITWSLKDKLWHHWLTFLFWLLLQEHF